MDVLTQDFVLCGVAAHLGLRGMRGLLLMCRGVAHTVACPSMRAQLLLAAAPTQALSRLLITHCRFRPAWRGVCTWEWKHWEAVAHCLVGTAALLGLPAGAVSDAARGLGLAAGLVVGPESGAACSRTPRRLPDADAAQLQASVARALQHRGVQIGVGTGRVLLESLYELAGDCLAPGLATGAHLDHVRDSLKWVSESSGTAAAAEAAATAALAHAAWMEIPHGDTDSLLLEVVIARRSVAMDWVLLAAMQLVAPYTLWSKESIDWRLSFGVKTQVCGTCWGAVQAAAGDLKRPRPPRSARSSRRRGSACRSTRGGCRCRGARSQRGGCALWGCARRRTRCARCRPSA